KVFMVYLDTLNRLNICNPAENIKRNQARTHPIHYAAYDSERRQWLTENYRTAFGEDLIPNTQYGSLIPLCIGKPVKLEGTYEDEQVRQEKYAEILEKYKQVQDQGDGIKSFTGILLYLMMDNYCTYLIDEPEAFLHPPQAKIMGSIIGKKLSTKKQAFIATHSEEIVKGLMESAPHRIKIIRIDRDENNNFISILNNNDFNKVWSDPLLRYSNIMSSLFHKTVVLCESDSDCRMYSIVDNYLKRQEGKYSETLFIHCGGKHRMAKIIIALKSLGVNIRVISDIDVLNDEGVIRGIAESVGLEWGETLKKYYNVLASNLHSSKENINRNEAKTTINRVLGQSDNQDLSNSEIKEIRNAIKLESKWKTIKDNGKIAIPSGEATDAFNKLSDALEDKDIFLVPVGELEGFVKDVGGHGPEWVNAVLERYPELDNPIFDTIKKFVITLNI
ncbi:MAG TPA: AAA family ATPase, partial [Candidatus Dorea intestinavium]|nr:AAA family ATPase [Candidatus Dorea intestinavium]